jgi:hypothetical protein
MYQFWALLPAIIKPAWPYPGAHQVTMRVMADYLSLPGGGFVRIVDTGSELIAPQLSRRPAPGELCEVCSMERPESGCASLSGECLETEPEMRPVASKPRVWRFRGA